jgi:hypothetical protein
MDLGPSLSQWVKLAADALHGASPEAQELGGFQQSLFPSQVAFAPSERTPKAMSAS